VTDAAEAGAGFLTRRLGAPRAGIVLGSGFAPLAQAWGVSTAVPFHEIPGYPVRSVPGHDGGVAALDVEGVRIWIFLGRLHTYEGFDALTAAYPVQVLGHAGAARVLLTCAAGGLLPGDRPGDFAVIEDHINLLGDDPVRRIPVDRRRVPFPDLQHLYDPAAAAAWRKLGADSGLRIRGGILAAMPGPCYETPAEVRMLRALGADLASMSVVPEAILARYLGLTVSAIACISNRGAGSDAGAAIAHQAVVDVVGRAVVRHAAALRNGAVSMLV
jgi:purine-nucleoside phosphorylase